MSYSLLLKKKKKKKKKKKELKAYREEILFLERDSRRSVTWTNTFHPFLNTPAPPPPGRRHSFA